MSLPGLLDEAIGHHRAGRLDAAEHTYRSLLRVAPDHPDALHLLGVTLGQRGRLNEALRLIDQAIALRPRAAAYHGNRGEVLRKLGNHNEAVRALEIALDLDPALASAHNNLGMIQLQAGDPEQALASFDRAIACRGDFATAHINRADALQALHRLDEAAAAYRQALQYEPDNAWVHAYLGHVLVERGDIDLLDEALLHCQRACALAPGLGQAHTNLGNVWSAMGRLDDALACYRRALELDPALSLPWNNIGRVEQQLGRVDAAHAAYDQALALDPRAARFHANLATLLAEQDRDDEAVARFRIAIDCDPNHAESYSGLAVVLSRMGHRSQARAALDTAIRINPRHAGIQGALARFLAEDGDFAQVTEHARAALASSRSAEAYFLLTMVLRDRLPDADLGAMIHLMTHKYLNDESRALLNFAVAGVLDARGRHDEAAPYFDRGNAHQRTVKARQGEVVPAGKVAWMTDEMIASFTPAFFAALRGRGSPSRRPIFVVGMPRSGTTLVEQVLASHSRVFGAGELEDVGRLAHEIADEPLQPGRLATTLLGVDQRALTKLADRYLARLEELDRSADHVVDKMPGNYINLGLITVLWPEARVIVCRRDPRDIAVSCWATSFGAIRWANDLVQIAEQIIGHDRLMAHWNAVLPRPPIEVVYEALVADFENQARRLIDSVGLPWDPACLQFHTLQRPIRTASLQQVRQPIYSHSVGRWKRYQASLTPFFETFARHNHPLEDRFAPDS